ncbi:MAG TPA: hypothetical protein VM573_02110 [Actinomycetota bacterium]|jgi:hypothetical protein|nr:hypothetical protein [Actinomycetota bacterium]
MSTEDEVQRLRQQAKSDRDLIVRAERALAEIDRAAGLTDEQADVLAALRIRIEGRERAKLEDLLAAAGDIGARRDLGDALAGAGEGKNREWPDVEEKPKDWPGL